MKQNDQETEIPIQQTQADSKRRVDSVTRPISDEAMSDLVNEFFNRLKR